MRKRENGGEYMVRLTEMVKTSGCAAKLAPADLAAVVEGLDRIPCDRLIGGYDAADDALVYDLGDGNVCIETVDFFPPMVDDPYTFGQIAAANALSDIYAMGAVPAVAMNLVCFPACLPLSVLSDILSGGISKLKEAGCALGGGHTISDPTPKYGLSVTGFAKADSVWTNGGAESGDVLVLTKRIGTGAIVTAHKGGMCEEEHFQGALESMKTLNRRARDCARKLEVHSATDVTGFSLLGHSGEMAAASGRQIVIRSSAVPLLDGALEAATFGLLPEGLYNNRAYIEHRVSFDEDIPLALRDILFDPQTSGGLLLSMPRSDAEKFISVFGEPAAIVGEVQDGSAGTIIVRK